MLHVNLIKDSLKYKYLRKVSFGTNIGIIAVLSVTFAIYLIILLRLFILQSSLNELSSRIPEKINNSVVNPQQTTKSLYGYEKLKAIRRIYTSGPEYFDQYDYLLGLIAQFKGLTIDNLTLNDKSAVQLTLSSEQREDLFHFIEALEKPEVKKKFLTIKVSNLGITSSDKKQKEKKDQIYSAAFLLQFLPFP